MKKVIFAAIAAAALTSCGHHRDGTSVWAEWTWVLLVVTIGPALLFYYNAWRQSRSGSSQQIPGGGTVYSDKNVPFYKTWSFVFAVIFTLAAIGVAIWVNAEKG